MAINTCLTVREKLSQPSLFCEDQTFVKLTNPQTLHNVPISGLKHEVAEEGSVTFFNQQLMTVSTHDNLSKLAVAVL